MNKKGRFDGIMVGGIAFMFFFALVFSSMIYVYIDGTYRIEERDKACNKLNMEHHYIQGSDVCIDKNNEAHYVKIDCENIKWREWDCIPRIISVGEIRMED